MSDIREALAHAMAASTQRQAQETGGADWSVVAADVLAEFVVFEGPHEPRPAWLVDTFYGVRENGVVYPASSAAHAVKEAERRRGATAYRQPAVVVEAVQRRVLPVVPAWMPIAAGDGSE